MNTDHTNLIIKGLIAFLVFVLFLGTFTIIGPGQRGVVVRLGAIDRVMDEGWNWKIPVVEKVKKLDVKTQKIEVGAAAASKDLQTVSVTIALNFNLEPDQVDSLWQEIGKRYRARIIDPSIQESVKAATAQFNADELITKRPEVKEAIRLDLTERLKDSFIRVTDVSIVNFSFSEQFDIAIEAKVTAEQSALEAENKLRQVEFEAQQRIEEAKAEAEAIRIQARAINSQGGEDYVQLQAIEKWNGVLPTQFVPGSAIPFLNLIK